MSQQFRLGIIGCGRIAIRHVKAGLASALADVSVLVDPVAERTMELSQQFQLDAKIVSSPEEAFDCVDGFVIAAPNHLHRRLAIECLQKKIPVLIEKPLATTVEDGEEICKTAAETGTVAAVGYVTRFRDNVKLFHQLYTSGYFGVPQRFAYQFGTRGGWTPFSSYHLDKTSMGGGVMVGTGSHFLDRMLYWFGYPDEVRMSDDAAGGPEANSWAEFEFLRDGNRFFGAVETSKTVRRAPGFAMETDRGIVILPDDPHAKIRFRTHDAQGVEQSLSSVNNPQHHQQDSFLIQLEDFITACRDGRDPQVTASQGLLSVKLIEELYASRKSIEEDWYAQNVLEKGSL